MSKVLVTGSSGFIGSKISRSYAQSGHEVLGIDVREIPQIGFKQKQCDLLSLDIKELFADFSPDLIVHCAGNANVSVSVEKPFFDFELSAILLHKMLFGIRDCGIKPTFLLLSSAAVYGSPKTLPISEDVAVRPISPYGLHKAHCEQMCEYFTRVEGVPCAVARIFSAYGAGLRKQLFWDLANKMLSGDQVELFGTGEETRDFIHVDDVVQAVKLLGASGEVGVFNLASGQEKSVREVATLLANALDIGPKSLKFNGKTKEGDPKNWRADISRIKSIGFSQTVSVESGIAEYGRWVIDGSR